MLYRLAPAQNLSILALFAPLDFNLVIRSVVEGNTPAWVYADQVEKPTLALIWDRQDAILIAGSPSSSSAMAVHDVILGQIVPDARPRGIPGFALLFPPGWENLLPEALRELQPQPAMRLSYRLPAPWEQSGLTGLPKPPEGFELRRIDDGLLESQLVNLQEVRGWIDSFWATPQDFLHTGFGYCAITGDTIAAWCLTVFAAGNEREVGLATMPEYRQRGLATLVAVASIEHALAHGLIPHWHCWADNLPSRLVAEKTGFHLEREYPSYRLAI